MRRNLESFKCTGNRHVTDLADQIGSGVDGNNAVQIGCRLRVDAVYPRVRINAAENRTMQGVSKFDVIDIMSNALNEPRVFRSFNALTDISPSHISSKLFRKMSD